MLGERFCILGDQPGHFARHQTLTRIKGILPDSTPPLSEQRLRNVKVLTVGGGEERHSLSCDRCSLNASATCSSEEEFSDKRSSSDGSALPLRSNRTAIFPNAFPNIDAATALSSSPDASSAAHHQKTTPADI